MLSMIISAGFLGLWVCFCAVSGAEDTNMTRALKLMSEVPLIDG